MVTPALLSLLVSPQIPSSPMPAESFRVHPVVLEMKTPTCPPMVKLSGISGTAKFLVETDGRKVKNILKAEGPPMLQRQLPSQLMTWRFEEHTPTEFIITFKINVVFGNPNASKLPQEIKMILPSYIEITTYSVGECDPVVTQEKQK